MDQADYDAAYFESFRSSARASARVVVPLVLEWIHPGSVIDLGCGLGVWLSVFAESGVDHIRGVDGSHVQKDLLQIPVEAFSEHNLEQAFRSDRSYDLAVSLEVAEHLPAASAEPLVQSIVALAPVVLFSASIPHQSGRHHVNCQPPGYWSKLFSRHGYVVIDCLRPLIWEDPRVDWWYRQNIMIYADEGQLSRWPELQKMRTASPVEPPHLVHPECFQEWVKWGLSQSRLYWDLRLGGEDSDAAKDEEAPTGGEAPPP